MHLQEPFLMSIFVTGCGRLQVGFSLSDSGVIHPKTDCAATPHYAGFPNCSPNLNVPFTIHEETLSEF